MAKTPIPQRRLYPAAECRALLGIGKTYFYELVRQNELHLLKLGRRSYVTSESIEALISRRLAATREALSR